MPRSVMKEAMGLQTEKGFPLFVPQASLSVVHPISAPESPFIPSLPSHNKLIFSHRMCYSFPGQFSIACSMQKLRGKPSPVYQVNDVCLDRGGRWSCPQTPPSHENRWSGEQNFGEQNRKFVLVEAHCFTVKRFAVHKNASSVFCTQTVKMGRVPVHLEE